MPAALDTWPMDTPLRLCLPLSLLIFAGCGVAGPGDDDTSADDDATADDLSPESEASISSLQDTIALSAILADVTTDVDRDTAPSGDRGGDGGGCPSRAFSMMAITLDYGAGCVPTSGWTDSTVAGSVTLAIVRGSGTLTAVFDDFSVNGQMISGSVAGSYERTGQTLAVDIQADLAVTTTQGQVEWVASLTGSYTTGQSGVVLDGSVASTSASETTTSATLTGLDLVYVQNWICPLPSGGSATLVTGSIPTTVTFSSTSPSTGEAAVQVGPLTQTVDVCAFSGELL